MKQVMIKSLTVTSFLIILILLVIEIAKYRVPEYFPADTPGTFLGIKIIVMFFEFVSASKDMVSDCFGSNGFTNCFDMAETDNQRNGFPGHQWNDSLDMFFPIINTCILECPIDSDHILCQSKFNCVVRLENVTEFRKNIIMF